MKGISGFRFWLPAALAGLACTDPTSVTPPDIQPSTAVAVLPPGAIPVNACGTVIAQPGDYWLTRDLINCEDPFAAITIEADDVTLHLNGHRLAAHGVAPVTEICIRVRGTNARVRGPGVLGFCWKGIMLESHGTLVRGVNLSGFDLGIYMSGGGNHVIEDVSFGGSGFAALFMGASDNNLFRHNTVRGSALEHSFMVNGSGNLIESNTVDANTEGVSGLAMDIGGTRNTVADNQIRGWFTGVNVYGAGNAIAGNRIRSTDIGIHVTGTGHLITGNMLENNNWDMIDDNEDACVVNTYTGNRFTRASPDCLQ